ncbi:MAG: cupin domain-containing protein [Xanthobacteraceae bacterium]
MFDMLLANRRDLLIAPLLAAIPAALCDKCANASPIDPNMTFTKLPDQIVWQAAPNRPPKTVEQAPLWGKSSEPGLYYYLVKWYPGFMSAPHWYETDRLCVVVSGTWWVASGEDFEPNDTVPMPAGSFIRRVARTPHYDGVKKDGQEPAVIAICGMGPITYHAVDPSKPELREL